VGHVGYFWVSKRERNRRFKEGTEKPSSVAFVSPEEENDKQCYQNNIVCSFFFFNEEQMKRSCFFYYKMRNFI